MSKLIAWCAGHGSNTYPPNKGVPGLPEHEFNAAVIGYILPLAEFNGFRNLVVQPLNGPDRPLSQRITQANAAKADFYFSAHADANSSAAAYGHWGAYWHTANDSKRFAQIWQKHADNILPNTNPSRRIFPSVPGTWSEYAVCRDTKMPAFIAEHGFMTNASDLKHLKSDSFRRLCAEVAVRAVCEYFGMTFKKPTNSSNTGSTNTTTNSGNEYKTGSVISERFRDTTVKSLFLKKGTFRAKLVESKWKTVSQLVKEHGADFGVNFPYHYNGELLGNIKIDGELTSSAYGKMLKWHSIGFTPDGEVRIGSINPSGEYDSLMQGAPTLINNGSHSYEFHRKHQEVNDDIGMSRYHDPVKYRIQPQRTFFTYSKSGDVIISISDGRTSPSEMGLDLKDMAEYADRFDPDWTINGDGGDSSVLIGKDGKAITRLRLGQERQNNHALLIFMEEEKPLPQVVGTSKTEVILTDDKGNVVERRDEDSLLVRDDNGETFTYLPLRKLADSVGGTVGWNQQTRTSSLTIEKR